MLPSRFLADVGFAGTNSLAPMSMDTTETQTLVDGVFRVTIGDDGWHTASSQLNGEWRDLYTFRNEPTSHIDLELSNWCAQCLAATTCGARYTAARRSVELTKCAQLCMAQVVLHEPESTIHDAVFRRKSRR